MSQAPAMPLLWGDYWSKTRRLSPTQHHAYLFLLGATWMNNCEPFPDDDEVLARVIGITTNAWKKIRPALIGFFDLSERNWRNHKLEEVWDGVMSRVEKNRENGGRGAAARWRNSEEIGRGRKLRRSQRLAEGRAKGRHTEAEWKLCLEIFGHRCVACGSVETAAIVKDHIVPLYQGGSDSIENLQPLCWECNSKKGGGDAIDHRDPILLKELYARLARPGTSPDVSPPPDALQTPDNQNQNQKDKKIHTPEPSPSAGKVEGEFGELWSVYPRKVDRGHALKAYRGARKKTDAQTLLAAVRRFAEDVAGKEARFIPHAATWLNGERWLEYEPLPAAAAELNPEERRRQTERDWFFRQAVEDFHHDAIWPKDVGPPPTDPDCRAPRWVLIRFGYGKAA